MSSYPPPPPPGRYPPVFDNYAAKAQRRAIKAQVRMQQIQQRAMRNQMRAQRRALRRSSIVGPLIVLALGVVFLLAQLGKLSWGQSFEWYGRWWPAVLIAAGVVLLIEWAIDQNRPDSASHGRVIGGGVIFLLILLALAGLSARGIQYGLDWHDQTFNAGYTRWDHLFGDRHDADSSINSPLPAGSSLIIRNPHGDVTVTGSSSDGQVHVSVHTQTYAWKDDEAEEKSNKLQPVLSNDGGVLSLVVNSVEGGEADLTVEMPRNSPLTVQANRGDLSISEMSAPLTLTANHGDVDVSGINSAVTLHVNDDNSSVTMHSIQGQVSVQGHSGDIDVSDITGDVAFQGDFFGTTHLEHVNGAVHFESSRTHFSAARLDDELSIERGSLDGSALMGPVILKTTSKNITLDRVQGSVDLSNSNGSVELTNAAPLDTITIQNHHGSVDLGLAGTGGFSLNAQTRNGDMENDFGLSPDQNGDTHTLRGQVATGGPTITIATTDGDVTVRRSTVVPLPPTPPAPPQFTTSPPPPPKAPRKLNAAPSSLGKPKTSPAPASPATPAPAPPAAQDTF
jgi:DUF4097 and DUF4098 domain-containing protein YvlB